LISLVSGMHPTALFYMFCARDHCSVACWCWLPGHISEMWWTLSILCDFVSSASLFNSKLFSVCMVSNAKESPANIPLWALANCFTKPFSGRVSPEVLDCLYRNARRPRENEASTPTPCGIMEIMLHASLETSVYFECVCSC